MTARNLRQLAPLITACLLAPVGVPHASGAVAAEPTAAAAHDDALRFEVERALAAFAAAVLSNDPDAVLAHIVPATGGPHADPVFRKEMLNWAADLAHHPVAEFDLQIAETASTPPVFTADAAEFELRMRWRIARPAGDAGPADAADEAANADPAGTPSARVPANTYARNAGRRRGVSFPARFVRDPDSGQWLYAGEAWSVLERGGARVKFMPGFEHLAEGVLDAMPAVRAHVEEGFDIGPDGFPRSLPADHPRVYPVPPVQEIKLYASMQHLLASIYLSYTDAIGGWNEPGESMKLLTAAMGRGRPDSESLRTLLAHEFAHVATAAYGPHAVDAPWWLVEGVAELAAESFSRRGRADADADMRLAALQRRLAPWDEISDFRTTDRRWMGQVYAQGHHMVGFISERIGREGRNRLLAKLGRGVALDEVVQTVMGMGFDELDRQWRESLAAQARPAQEAQSEDAAPAGTP